MAHDINPKPFKANTFFPMPAQTGVGAYQLQIPSGTQNGGAGYANTLYYDLQLPEDTDYVRVNITSSRAAKTFVGSPVVFYDDDATFIAFVSARGNGLFRCYVLLTSGWSYTMATTSAHNITFNLTGFRVP